MLHSKGIQTKVLLLYHACEERFKKLAIHNANNLLNLGMVIEYQNQLCLYLVRKISILCSLFSRITS